MKEPELRFKEFKDEWQPRKLSEFSEKINERNESESYTSVLTNSAMYGVINQQDFFKKDIANPENIERYTIVKNNDYMYNPRISKYAKFGPVNRNKLNATGVVSPMYLVFRTDDTVSLGFLDNYFLSSYWHKYIYSKGNTGARADRIAIKDSDFMNMKILMPSLKEQNKIADFFSDLDSQIELQLNKLETLKTDKKGYLQKMFPNDDSNKPKLRLKGFSDDWKSVELKNISELSQGVVGDAMLNDGKYKITRIESISTGKINVQKLGFINEKPQDRYLLEKGDILFSNINSMKYIGNNAIFDLDKEIYHGTNLLKIRPLNVDPYFLYYELNTKFHTNWAKKHANPAVSQASINQTTLGQQPIKMPNSYNEQKTIAMFFKNLDKQIELQQRKVTDLKKQKKAYLQKMFI